MPKRSSGLKLVELGGEKSRVITFRLDERMYSALEKQAEQNGGTVSAAARSILLSNLRALDADGFGYRPGDTLESSTGFVVLLAEKDKPVSEMEIEKRMSKIIPSGFWRRGKDEK